MGGPNYRKKKMETTDSIRRSGDASRIVNSESATRLAEKEQTAERSSGRDRPEVEVSARARERADAERLAGQRSETERIAEQAQQIARQEARVESRVEAQKFQPTPSLAARLGPAPNAGVAQPTTPEDLARQALSERGGVVSVGDALAQPEPGQHVDMQLPGSGQATDVAAQLLGAQRGKAGSGVTQPLPGSGAQRDAIQQTEAQLTRRASDARVQEQLERPVQNEDVQVRTAVAAHTGDAARQVPERAELLGNTSELPGEKVAEASFTDAGAVTATADDNIVTRFFERSPDPDPGPEPRVREELGERSKPV